MRPKPVNYKLIAREDKPEIYDLVDDLIKQYHGDLEHAVVLLYWRSGWKPDADKIVRLAQVRLATDREKELREHDFTICLHDEFWDMLSDEQKRAIMDSQLTRVARAEDKNGDPREDSAGRPVWRLRRFEHEDFHATARRHNMTVADVQANIAERLGKCDDAEDGSYVAQQLEQ